MIVSIAAGYRKQEIDTTEKEQIYLEGAHNWQNFFEGIAKEFRNQTSTKNENETKICEN